MDRSMIVLLSLISAASVVAIVMTSVAFVDKNWCGEMGTPLMRRKNVANRPFPFVANLVEKQAATVLVALDRHNSIQLLNGGIIGDGNFTLSACFCGGACVHAQQSINGGIGFCRLLPTQTSG
jgi:hypothetical protein